MTDVKFSQISPSASNPLLTDQLLGVAGGSLDQLFTLAQVKQAVGGGGSLVVGTSPIGSGAPNRFLFDNAGLLGEALIGSGLSFSGGTLSATPGSGTDPLFLTQGFNITANNPTANGSTSDLTAARINVTYDNSAGSPGFTDRNGLEINLTGDYGQNTNGTAPTGTTNAKTTWLPIAATGIYNAAGQKNIYAWNIASYGMGDASLGQYSVGFAGGPVGGDEGQALNLFSHLGQFPSGHNTTGVTLMRGTITNVVRSTIAAGITVTQPITGSISPQTVTVSATTGILANDWLCIGQEVMNGAYNTSEIHVTSVGVGTITAVILNNYNSGATLGAAMVITFSGPTGAGWGQQRFIVNETKPAVTAGTVSSISGGGFIGSGTSWAVNMVGGNSLNIGAICLAADFYAGTPFGSGTSGALNTAGLDSWYLITTVTDTTHLGIFTFSVAGDAAYHGYGPGTGAYTIRQAARILRPPVVVGGNVMICEPSTSTWSIGDTILCPVCAYPDVSGKIEQALVWTAGGIRRAWLDIQNAGAREWGDGILIESAMPSAPGTNTDRPLAWLNGLRMNGVLTGISINTVLPSDISGNVIFAGSQPAAIAISTVGTGQTGRISWGTNNTIPYIEFDHSGIGMVGQMTQSGFGGFLSFVSPSSGINTDTNLAEFAWGGWFRIEGRSNVADAYMQFAQTGGGPSSASCRIVSNPTIFGVGGQKRGFDFIGFDGTNTFNLFAMGRGENIFLNNWAGVLPDFGTNTSNVTNLNSGSLAVIASVWNGSAAKQRPASLIAVPGSGVNNAPITLKVQFLDSRQSYNINLPIDAWSVTETGIMFLGQNNVGAGAPTTGVSMNPTLTTAIRTVTWPDTAGGAMVVKASGGVPTSSGAAGTPGLVAQDGTSVYICYATNSWVKFAGTFSF